MRTIVSTAALKGADTRPSGRGGFTPPGLARASKLRSRLRALKHVASAQMTSRERSNTSRHEIEAADRHLERPAFTLEREVTFHRAPWRQQRAEARVLEAVARAKVRMLADHSWPFDDALFAIGVDDPPATGGKPNPA